MLKTFEIPEDIALEHGLITQNPLLIEYCYLVQDY